MNDTQRRLVGYGVSTVVLVALGYGGFVYQAEADTMSLLSFAEVHLKLAKSHPETDSEGNPNPIKQTLLAQAREFIERARSQDPDFLPCVEMDAFCRAQEGRYVEAATLYASARESQGANPASRSSDTLNEVRMWRLAGQHTRAFELLESGADIIVPADEPASQIERVFVLSHLGREEEAVSIAAGVARSSEDPLASIDAGLYLEERGDEVLGATAYKRAAKGLPVANYYLARLKVRAGEYDSSLDLLKLAVASDRRQVKQLIELDTDVWDAIRKDARFKDLFTVNTAAHPGR